MRKTKFSKLLILILVVTMAFSILALTACNTPEGHTNIDSNTEIDKDTNPVKNGSFEYSNGTDYPRVPISWSGTIGGTGKWQPEGGLDALKTGIINIGDDYEYNKSIWGAPKNPGKHPGEDVDDNILMIYASKPSSFSFASDSFTVKANTYYKLSFWVNTSTDLSGEMENGAEKPGTNYGAYLQVNGGNVNANWIDIKTGGVWQKFEMFIEGGNTNNTLKVTLGLGRGDNGQKHLTQGHIYFDDVLLEESTKDAYDAALVNHTPTGGNDNVYIHKDSFKFTNAYFTNYDRFYTSNPAYPFGWNDGVGGVDDDRASLIPTEDRPSVIKGIIDLDPEKFAKNKTSYGFAEDFDKNDLRRTGSNDTNVLMINTNKKYSVNYIASSSITVKKGTIYRFGTWVRTFNPNNDTKAKGTIMLYNDNEEYRISFDDEKIYFVDPSDPDKNVKTASLANPKEWNEIVFYLRGNNTHDVTYKVMLALGTDGKSKQDNWSYGHVLFDDITLSQVAVDSETKESTFAKGWAKAVDSKFNSEDDTLCVDLNKKDSTNHIESNIHDPFFINAPVKDTETGLLIPDGYELVKKETDVKFNGSINVVDTTSKKEFLPFDVIYKFGDAAINSELAKNVLEFKSEEGSTVGIKLKAENSLLVKMNKQYRLAFWVKTVDIEKSSGLFIKMNIYDKEDKVKDTKTVKVNSKTIDKEASNFENQWQEVVFYISGDANDDIKFDIELQYGDGTLFGGKLAKGSAYVYNMNYQQIDKSAYTNASTSDLVQKVDLTVETTSADKIANANFNSYKPASSSFDKTDGMLDKFADPSSWSVANDDIPKDVLTKKETVDGKEKDVDKKVSRGIVNLIDEYQDGKLILERMLKNEIVDRPNKDAYIADVIDAVKNVNYDLTDGGKNRFALAIYSDEDIINTYRSNYINLSANSYYSISIRVFTMPGTIASVRITSSSPHKENIDVFNKISSDAGWTEYTFFIKTGLSSASVSLDLSLGSLDLYNSTKKAEGLSNGLVLFDYATQVTYTEDTYKLAKENLGIPADKQLELEFDTDGFATDSYDKLKLNDINGWSKNPSSLNSEIAGNYSPVLSGILDWTMFDKNTIWTYDKSGEHDKNKITEFVDGKYNKVINAKKAANKYNGVTDEADLLKTPDYFGSSVLMIDNMTPSAISIYNSSSKTLSKSVEYYKVSILIYTDLVANDKEEKLNLTLKIGSRDEDLIEIKGIDTKGEWKEISFFIKNTEKGAPDLNATLTLQLGSTVKENDKETLNPVEGMVFADNFNIEIVDKAQYDAALADEKVETATKEYIPDKPIDPDKEDEDKPAPQKPGVDWQMLSWAIPTIILAVMILIVLGVFLYKKYAGPKQHKKFKGDKKKPKKQEIKKPDNFDSFED